MKMRKGFTLIELLVVVAIIVVLMAILMPSLGRARAQAKSVQCMSNLKQMGNGFQMYANEYNGWLPLNFQSVVNSNVMQTPFGGADSRSFFEWNGGLVGLGLLMPYLGYVGDGSSPSLNTSRPKIFLCPSAAEYEPSDPTCTWYGASVYPNFVDYMYLRDSVSPDLEPSYWGRQWHFGQKLTYLGNRNLVFCMSAGGWSARTPGGHMDGANFLFGDSHVEHLARVAYVSTPNGISNFWESDDLWRH